MVAISLGTWIALLIVIRKFLAPQHWKLATICSLLLAIAFELWLTDHFVSTLLTKMFR